MDNILYIPWLNPVKFFDVSKTNIGAYFTKHLDDYEFSQRIYSWQTPATYKQVWQTTDIVKLQLVSTFDPLILQLVNCDGAVILEQIFLVKAANKNIPNTFAFEIEMSLAGLTTDCYRLKIIAGTGEGQKILLSNCLYISSAQIKNTILMEYYNSRFMQDILFETGIKFQYRVHGSIGLLEPNRKDEMYRDERYTSTVLNSRMARQFPVSFGDIYGLPDDEIDKLGRIWGCNNVSIDGKSFCISEGGKFEFVEAQNYPKRGVRLVVEEGINRSSSIFTLVTDPAKKLASTVLVDAKVFGDTSNQGSSNAVPVINIE